MPATCRHFPVPRRQPAWRATLVLLAAGLACAPALAQSEAAALQQLRTTTLGLIEALVSQGLLSRERADALLRQATPPAVDSTAGPGWGSPPVAVAGAARPVQRVPYLSETVRAELREAIKLDVLEQARTEGWADARQIPSWSRAIRFSGDLRLRAQSERFDPANLPADEYQLQALLGSTPAWSPDLTNTTQDRHRLTLRARLAADIKISDDTSAGLRLSTGTTSGPTSSSQTLGNGFNKFSLTLDRAWLRWEPRYDWRLTGGRMAAPFFGTDLLWPDDLSLDGVAASGEYTVASGTYLYAHAGAFALEEQALSRQDKWLYGLQLGADWTVSDAVQLRLGLGVYDFHNAEGVREALPRPGGAAASTTAYLTREYPRSLRLKGNTLINLNDPTSTAAPTWGLASKFRPVNLSVALAYKLSPEQQAIVSLDWVKNTAFDLADIERRAADTRVRDVVERTTGLQLRLQFGSPALGERGQWQGFAALRKFDRDAWLDGLTDTTWHGGGTGYQGWSLGARYAFDRRTHLGMRWTSTRNLDDRVVSTTFPLGTLSGAPLKLDVLQLDLNTRF
jgi:Putative porin